LNRGPLTLKDYQTTPIAKANELLIYDEIGYWGITAKQFRQDLGAVAGDEVTVRINSPGGDVFEGVAIYNTIKADNRPVSIVIDGLAASAASFIAMAGDDIEIADNAFMMIHRAWGFVIGNAMDLRETADFLEKIDDQIAEMYAKRGNEDAAAFLAMMDAETWLNAKESKALDLVDTITDEAEAQALFDLSHFNAVPAAMKRRVEHDLRDVGYSQSAAARAVAKGFSALEREVPEHGHREGDLQAVLQTLAKHGY